MRSQATSPTSAHGELARRHEILGIVCGALTLLSALALLSYDLRGGENWIGPLGETLSRGLVQTFGMGAGLLPLALGLGTLKLLQQRPSSGVGFLSATFLTVLVGCALLHLSMGEVQVFGGHQPGGVIGELLGEVLRSIVGLAGAYVICISTLLVTLVVSTSISVVSVSRRVGVSAAHSTTAGVRTMADGWRALWQAWREAKAIEAEERERVDRARQPSIVGVNAPDLDDEDGDAEDGAELEDDSGASVGADAEEAEDASDEDQDADEAEDEAEEPAAAAQLPKPARKKRETGPTIVKPIIERSKARSIVLDEPRAAGRGRPFVLPPSSLLTPPEASSIRIDEDKLKENAVLLVEKLEAYGVKGRVDEIHPGPVVTMYEFEPASGTKVSKIAGLADDLAMALAAQKVRIVAPLPGKARVGFELPNDDRQMVNLRELVEDEGWRNFKATLPVVLGKDIQGRPVYGDLAKMPHVLVAGATGAGKSVGLNVMLTSLLMKKTPDEVRMLMIDPKVVELAVFDRIPHMLLPVVTDMKKAALALKWAVDEMERRYQLFADAGARNVASYNARVEKVLSGEMSVATFAPRRAGKVRAMGQDGEELLLDPSDGERQDAEDWRPETLPSVVVVVDEFADLMMVAAKDVEAAIARLAQKARAAGIHVILATQRPSVDVITGMIKANFPSRIGFKVSQREDSKTILGRTGAEHLLGLGDMLTLLPGSNDLKRVHSAFISEDEVKDVCDHLRAQGDPIYDDEILKPRDDEDGEVGGGAASDDPIYDRAVAVVAEAGYCSISHIQRKLEVGYNKAAKLVERMEAEGVVGPPTGKAGGRREVFVGQR